MAWCLAVSLTLVPQSRHESRVIVNGKWRATSKSRSRHSHHMCKSKRGSQRFSSRPSSSPQSILFSLRASSLGSTSKCSSPDLKLRAIPQAPVVVDDDDDGDSLHPTCLPSLLPTKTKPRLVALFDATVALNSVALCKIHFHVGSIFHPLITY